MMQDAVLTLSRESVHEFVEFILKFCPEDTKIVSTKEVINTFKKKQLSPEDSDYEEMPFKDIAAKEQNEMQSTMQMLHKMFRKDKDPEPLFVLDLILKTGSLIPTYSTNPEDIVSKIM
jgi:hypothetical protein